MLSIILRHTRKLVMNMLKSCKLFSLLLLLFSLQFQIYATENIPIEDTLPYEIEVQDTEYCSMGNIRTFDFSSTGDLLITISSPADIFKIKHTYYINFYDANNVWLTTFKIDAMGYLAAHFNEQDEIELYLDRNSQMFVIDSSGRLISEKSRDIGVMDVQKGRIEKDGIIYYKDILSKKIYYYDLQKKECILFSLSASVFPIIFSLLPALPFIIFVSCVLVFFMKKRKRI